MKILRRHDNSIRVGIWSLILLILIAGEALSNSILPYQPGQTQTVPGAAARMTNTKCARTYDGCVFSFDIEVFASAWKPVYSIKIINADEMPFSPVSWPAGWSVQLPASLVATANDQVIISTVSDPIMPGTSRPGFALSAHSDPLILRWYPEDENGQLIGKASVENLMCPLPNQPDSWGAIKALYR